MLNRSDRKNAIEVGGVRGYTRLPIIESVPYFLFDDDSREQLAADLARNNLKLRTPKEYDLTDEVRQGLVLGEVMWSLKPEVPFSLTAFANDISAVRGSPQFDNIYMIKKRDKHRWVMVVDRLIETVIDLHPQFMRIYQPDAVRIKYHQSQNTWVAPFIQSGKPAIV